MYDRDRKLITTVMAGPLLERELASMAILDRMRAPKRGDEVSYPNSTGHRVRPAGSGDQELLLTVSEYSDSPPQWRNLGLYARPTGGNWRRTFSVGVAATDLPHVERGATLQAAAGDATGHAAVPSSVPGLIAACLQDPTSAPASAVADSPARSRYAEDFAVGKRKAAAIGTLRRDFRPGPLLLAVRATGALLVLGALGFDQTLTARGSRKITFRQDSAQHNLYPGRYRRTTYSYGVLFAAVVPETGKITMIAGEERMTGLTAE